MTLLQFDEYELDITHRRLSEGGKPLRLGSRAFDILAVLASRAGDIVSKEELIDAVWATTTVDDGALRVHLVSLRKALGERARRYIENVPGRGYMFAAPISQGGDFVQIVAGRSEAEPERSLPRVTRKLLGRGSFVSSTAAILSSSSLVTIVGAGGMGKTSVAIAVAHGIADRLRVVFLDLATIPDADGLLPSLATRLGLSVYGADVMSAIVAELRKVPVLVVLDNCEHVIELAAEAVETILQEVPGIKILATSREPLRVQHEKVRQLPPLDVPPEGEIVGSVENYPALELFVSLASLAGGEAEIADPQELGLASDIVRRLDGIPLAIELAAARAFDMDLATLHRSVADPIALLRRGRRTAPPRQQTLKATLDWSYDLLSEGEKQLLVRLSVFASRFSAEDARAVSGKIDEEEFHEALDGLFLKSLLSVSEEGGLYRLLVTTREYVLSKLRESGHEACCREAHARYCLSRLLEAEEQAVSMDSSTWRTKHSGLVDDVRAALAWCFSSQGDADLGLDLSASSHILWTNLGLMAEQMDVSERALGREDALVRATPATKLKLLISCAGTMYHIRGSERDRDSLAMFEQAVEIATEVADLPRLLRSKGGISAVRTMNGQYEEAIAIARSLDELSAGRVPYIGSRLLGHNLHYAGDLAGAMTHAQISLGLAQRETRGTLNNGVGYDQRLSPLSTIVKNLWVQGNLSATLEMLTSTFNEAIELDNAISTCLFLASAACPAAFGMRDHQLGSELLFVLLEKSTENSLLRWREWALAYQAGLMARHDGDAEGFNRILLSAKGAMLENCLVAHGEFATLETLDRALSSGSGWCRAELYRLRGELLMQVSPSEGRRLILDGYELAAAQGAGFWELRSAASLMTHAAPGERSFARDRLSTILHKFSGEPPVPDTVYASSLL